MAFTISDLVVETLERAGVRRVYGLPGDFLNGLTDALRRSGSLAWEHGRHEEAGVRGRGRHGDHGRAGGLCGELRSRKPAPVERSLRHPPVAGTGAGDRGAHPSREIGKTYFRKTHPQELFRECSSYCELASSPAQFPYVRETAVRTALETRSVAVLVVPGDVLMAESRRLRAIPTIHATAPGVRPSDSELGGAARALDAAERVTAGAGCAGVHEKLCDGNH
jgi:pyruvate dehydrogenase (quinone)